MDGSSDHPCCCPCSQYQWRRGSEPVLSIVQFGAISHREANSSLIMWTGHEMQEMMRQERRLLRKMMQDFLMIFLIVKRNMQNM